MKTDLLERSPRPAAVAVRQPARGARGRRVPSGGRLVRSRWTRVGLVAFSVVCLAVASAATAFPTLSNWWAGARQHALAAQLDDPTLAGQLRSGSVGDGRPVGRIDIPAIGADFVVVQGVSASDLASGPGHYPGTPMPCSAGNAGIAGHRTTFLHPFYALDELRPGDVITITTPTESCAYRVDAPPFAVAPTDTGVLHGTPGDATLTLTTCTPRGSAAQRLIVTAALVPGSLRPAPTSARAPA
ncbi:MAG TPA: class E sortase [Acidimicrobiales bacterium]|nr:class E sortase [Acidimicrobiales bacterium]